jgi:hypothetical protein
VLSEIVNEGLGYLALASQDDFERHRALFERCYERVLVVGHWLPSPLRNCSSGDMRFRVSEEGRLGNPKDAAPETATDWESMAASVHVVLGYAAGTKV